MPDQGRGDPAALVTLPDGEWTAAGARIIQVTYEVDQGAALDLLPASATRPVPCYGRIIVVEWDRGRFGGLFVGGRYNLLPRNVLVAAVQQGDAAPAGQAGDVSDWHDDGRAGATVRPGDVQVDLVLPALRAVDPSMLRWDAWLGRDGGGALVERMLEPTLERAWLSKGATVEVSGDGAEPWTRLANLKTISACMAEGSVRLAPMPAPAGAGQRGG